LLICTLEAICCNQLSKSTRMRTSQQKLLNICGSRRIAPRQRNLSQLQEQRWLERFAQCLPIPTEKEHDGPCATFDSRQNR
jgi:hypothetical protein